LLISQDDPKRSFFVNVIIFNLKYTSNQEEGNVVSSLRFNYRASVVIEAFDSNKNIKTSVDKTNKTIFGLVIFDKY